MEEGKGERYLATGRQYGNALLGVRHQEEKDDRAVSGVGGLSPVSHSHHNDTVQLSVLS